MTPWVYPRVCFFKTKSVLVVVVRKTGIREPGDVEKQKREDLPFVRTMLACPTIISNNISNFREAKTVLL